jgi:ubiquinone biosynthesis protein UbiJ
MVRIATKSIVGEFRSFWRHGSHTSASARRTDRMQALESRLDELAARVERLEQER